MISDTRFVDLLILFALVMLGISVTYSTRTWRDFAHSSPLVRRNQRATLWLAALGIALAALAFVLNHS